MERERGRGRVFQRGRRFWIAYYAPGDDGRSVEHRELGGKDEKEAGKKLKVRLAEVEIHKQGLRQFHGPRQERVLVKDLLAGLNQDYEIQGRKSLRRLKSHLKHIQEFFIADRAMAVTSKRLRDYVAFRQGQNAAPATINRELEGLQRAFSLAVENSVLSMSPKFPSLPERNARQGFFERSDFQQILAKIIDPDVRDFLEWFFWTGMRPGEIRSLTWADLDKETMTLRLHARDAKTGYGRMIALEGDLRTIIERRIEARRLNCPYMFHRRGKQIGTFRKRWKTACKAAGFEGRYIPYDLRRTAVRNMVRAGVDPAVAMRISGHRTRAVFDRYNIISEADLREAMLKTAAYVATLPGASNIVPLKQVQQAHEPKRALQRVRRTEKAS